MVSPTKADRNAFSLKGWSLGDPKRNVLDLNGSKCKQIFRTLGCLDLSLHFPVAQN